MEDIIIKETDKSEISIDNSNNLFVIISETGPGQPIQLDDQFENAKTDKSNSSEK